jgi:site-specific DNA recombinase
MIRHVTSPRRSSPVVVKTRKVRARRRALVYCRISDLDPRKEANVASLDRQEREGRERAASLGYDVVDVVALREQYSGEELGYRPKINEVIAAAEAGECDVVIFTKIDRLARDPSDISTIIRRLHKSSCRIECIETPIGDTDDDGLILFVKGYAARREWQMIRQRACDGKHDLMKAGKRLRQSPKYGYDVDRENRRFLVNGTTAQVVRWIFQWIAYEGYSCARVARRLHKEGVPTPRTALGHHFSGPPPRWRETTVRSIVRDETYLGGRILWGRTRCAERLPSGRHRQVAMPRDQWEVFPTDLETTPRLIDDETFAAAQEALSSRRGRYFGPPNRECRYLVRGLISCSLCGTACYPVSGKRRPGSREFYRYYRCKKSVDPTLPPGQRCRARMIPAAWVDADVEARIRAMLESPGAVEAEIRRQSRDDAMITQIREWAEVTRQEIEAEERVAAKLMDRFKASVASGEDGLADRFEANLRLSEEKLGGLRGRLRESEGRLAAMDSSEQAAARTEALLDTFRGSREELTFEILERLAVALKVRVTGEGRTKPKVSFESPSRFEEFPAAVVQSASSWSQTGGNDNLVRPSDVAAWIGGSWTRSQGLRFTFDLVDGSVVA